MTTLVLIHSPLVGPLTWTLVADDLRQRGVEVIVPLLLTPAEASPPYWKQHADAVARALEPISPGQPLILVGHSGAGVLLPAIRQTTGRPVGAYLFVDAGIPKDGVSRLDLFALFASPEEAGEFRQAASDGLLPTWSEEDLRGAIQDAELRQRFVAELRPLPLAVYEEPIPVFAGWPDAPCGYLHFSPAYEMPAERARRDGWEYAQLDGEHFHMLVDPAAVANALVELLGRMGIHVV